MAFPESRFPCLTVSLRKVRSHQTPPPPPQETNRQRLAALVAKYKLHDGIGSYGDCFAGYQGDESNTDTSDNNRESGDSDDEVYT